MKNVLRKADPIKWSSSIAQFNDENVMINRNIQHMINGEKGRFNLYHGCHHVVINLLYVLTIYIIQRRFN